MKWLSCFLLLVVPIERGTAATCVADTTQCGGKGWKGATKCCSSNSVCTYRNEYYSKCMPKTTTPPTGCVADTTQCGGKGYTGATKCCSSGSVCEYRNEYYSKCMPKTTTPPTGCVADTTQCGGKGWTGQTKCCSSNSVCTYGNEYYSKCMPKSTPTTKPTIPSTGCVADTTQCGGKGWTGKTKCCSSGSVCEYRNEYYSKCMPKSSTSAPTTNKPTTSKPTTSKPAFTCDAGKTPCGHSNGGGAPPSPDSLCCATGEDCVAVCGATACGSQCISKNGPMTCEPNPCKNGTKCVYGQDGPYCNCKEEIPPEDIGVVDPSSTSPNGQFAAYYTGLFCETPLYP